jgi:4-methyl-5(b-hydroxyethyl)-thiazole monophosphate biosynthesis
VPTAGEASSLALRFAPAENFRPVSTFVIRSSSARSLHLARVSAFKSAAMSAFAPASCAQAARRPRATPAPKARDARVPHRSALQFSRRSTIASARRGAAAAAAAEDAPKKVLVPVADGTEEIEAVTVIDVLRRAGAEVVVMSVEDGRNEVVCSRGVRLVADANVKELAGRGAPSDWDLIAVPGGMPGAEHIADHVKFHAVLEKHFRAGKLMAAICAAPAICFEPKGFLEGYAATAHPNFVDELGGSLLEKNVYKECRVVVDTQIVTSRGPGTSMEWALCLVEQLYGSKKAREVAAPMVVQPANARLRQNLEWRLDETPLE